MLSVDIQEDNWHADMPRKKTVDVTLTAGPVLEFPIISVMSSIKTPSQVEGMRRKNGGCCVLGNYSLYGGCWIMCVHVYMQSV